MAPQPSPHPAQVSPLRSMSQSLSRVAPLPINGHDIHLTSRHSHSTLHSQTLAMTPNNNVAASPHQQPQVELQSMRNRPASPATQSSAQSITEMYHQPLLHYKYVTDRSRSRHNVLQQPLDDEDEKTPLQVLLPGSDSRQMVLATSDVKLFKQLVAPSAQAAGNRSSITQQPRGSARAATTSATEFLLYFNHHLNRTLANPLAHKYNIYVALTFVFVVIDMILVSCLYFIPNVFDSNLSQDYSGNTLVMYITCMICLAAVVISVILRDIRLMYLLCVVYYSLSLIQLLRIYSVVQFSHFVMQLAVCHALRQVRVTLTPIWTEPLR